MIELNIRPICAGLMAQPMSSPSALNVAAPRIIMLAISPTLPSSRPGMAPMIRRPAGRTTSPARIPCIVPATTSSSATR